MTQPTDRSLPVTPTQAFSHAQALARAKGLEKLSYWAGIGFGSGLSPKAPGTAASAAVLVLAPLWLLVGFWPSLAIIVVISLVGIPICGKTAELFGVHDDGRIVWDEFAGQSLVLLPLVWYGQMTLLGVVIAFGLFRLFDIWKPWPIRTLDEQVHGGLGIMLDDLLAGLVGAVCLIVLIKCSLLNSLL